MFIKAKIEGARVKIREKLNALLGRFRVRRLKSSNFTIISNNCWAGHVYRYYNLEYKSPTIGLFFYSDDYIKFVFNLKHYIDSDLTFINVKESAHYHDLLMRNIMNCPIGKLDDIEVVFLHYKSSNEAYDKWMRRKKRIVWDNIYYKMSEQNNCTEALIKDFDKLSTEKKFVFVTKDYGINSQIIWGGPCEQGNIPNDTVLFRKYVDLTLFLNGNTRFRKKQKQALRCSIKRR